ncbi:hypothetical protein HGRIS_012314 [Hohenbuehelia grisea]|uniref:Uncharacterized protein n=1 Tax=Hohenbuehelia grisea TaxID=104357 RepID=A0ABR3IRY7_9AGAR
MGAFVDLFSSPSVTLLVLSDLVAPSQDLTTHLKTFALSCPNLEVFAAPFLPAEALVALLASPTANSLPYFASLKCLDLMTYHGIPQAVLKHLSTYPRLGSLSLSFGDVIPDCASSISSTSLRHLSLSYYDGLTQKDCDYFRSLPHLTELTIGLPKQLNGRIYTSLSGGTAITLSDVRPLLDLQGLHELRFSIYSLRLGDDAIISISNAFPALRCLDVLAQSPSLSGAHTRQAHCTLAGLEALSKNCPHLKTLAAVIDTANPPSALLNFDNPQQVWNTALTRLAVGDSPEPDPEPTARALAAIFPSLREIVPESPSASSRNLVSKNGMGKHFRAGERWIVYLLKLMRTGGRVEDGETDCVCHLSILLPIIDSSLAFRMCDALVLFEYIGVLAGGRIELYIGCNWRNESKYIADG